MIIQQLSMSASLVIFYFIFERRGVLIGFSTESFKCLWSFGSKLLFANLLQTAYNNITTSIIPKIANVKESGLYFQASRINSIPNNVIMATLDKAIFPVLSKEDKNSFVSYANHINLVVYSLVFPLFPLLSLLSYQVILVVLGDKWVAGSDYLAILSWGGMGLIIQTLYRNVMKSKAYTSIILYVDIIKVVSGFVFLLVSIPFGVTFMVYAITLSSFWGAFVYVLIYRRKFKISVKNQIKDLFKPIFSSLITYAIFMFILNMLPQCNYRLMLVIPYLVCYTFISVIMQNKVLIEFLKQIAVKLCVK